MHDSSGILGGKRVWSLARVYVCKDVISIME